MALLVSFMSPWHKLVLGKRDSQVKRCLHTIGLELSLLSISLSDDWCGRDKSTGGDANLRQVVKLYKKGDWANHGEQTSNSVPLCPVLVPAARFLLEFLPWLPLMMELWCGSTSKTNPLFPKLLWLWCFTTAAEPPTEMVLYVCIPGMWGTKAKELGM